MEIAFITFEYPPFIAGGAGVYASNLTYELAKLGHKIHVFTPDFPSSEKEQYQEGLFIHKLSFINKPFLSAPSFWFSLRKEFSSRKKQNKYFDIVHLNGPFDLLLTKNLITCPRVLTVHHLVKNAIENVGITFFKRIIDIRSETGTGDYLEKTSIKRANHIIAVSKFTKQCILNSFDYPENNIDVVYHGVKPEDYTFSEDEKAHLRKDLGPTSQPLIFFAGGLDKRKGIDVLLKAMAIAAKQMDIKLILAGSGNQDGYIRMTRSLNIYDKVIFLGFVPNYKLRLLYSICNLFVFPSRLEGFGIAPLEAMAAGKPVIATRAGALPELIENGENGLLVDPDDESGLADAIVYLLENNTLTRIMGDNNLIKARTNYTWISAAEKVDRIYKKLAA